MSTNAHQRITVAFTLASAVSFGVGWLLTPSMGIRGAAVALLLTDVTMVFLVLRTSLRQLGETFTEFCSALLRLPARRNAFGLVN